MKIKETSEREAYNGKLGSSISCTNGINYSNTFDMVLILVMD